MRWTSSRSSIGADDYVTKPFSRRELAARVGAVLRSTPPKDERLTQDIDGDLQVDFDRHEVR